MYEGAGQKMDLIFVGCKMIFSQELLVSFSYCINIYVCDRWFLYIFQQIQVEKSANKTLRTENEKLRSENMAMKEAMKKIICPQCDSERASNLENLKAENQRLTDKVNLLSFTWKTLLMCK